MRDFAERLIAYETRGNKSSETKTSGPFLVGEKLRPHLATLMGNVGFRALLSRALALASAEVSWLGALRVKADGALEWPQAPRAAIDPAELLEGKVLPGIAALPDRRAA